MLAKGYPYISPTEKDLIPLVSLAPRSAMVEGLLHKSTRGGGKVERGEKFPYVPVGLEGHAAAGGMC